MSTEMLKNVGYVIGAVFLVIGKPMWDVARKKSKILWANAKVLSQQSIYRTITDIRAKLQVDRVDITEFTNGENSLGNVPFIFGNMTFEICSPHIKSIKSENKKFYTSWFAPVYAPLIGSNVRAVIWKDTGEYIVNGSDVNHDEAAGSLLVGEKIKSKLIIKFTQNIGDGIISLASYDNYIDLSKTDYKILLSDVHQIWYHLKLKR